MSIKKKWTSVCIVGIGGHAIKTIIPALKESNIEISGYVSSKKHFLEDDFIHFYTLEKAIKYYDCSTLFILTSPPSAHYKQSKILLENNFDVFVEKPAIIHKDELLELFELSTRKNLVFAEMFMYLESKSVQNFIKLIKKDIEEISLIKLIFTIPEIPSKTFRDENIIESSLFFDVGCYPISFLVYCNLELKNLVILSKKNNIINNSLFLLNAKSDNIEIESKFGCESQYVNSLELVYKNDRSLFIEPFFHGKSLEKKIRKFDMEISSEEIIRESNAFIKMFNHTRTYWLKNQNFICKKMIEIINYYLIFKKKYF